MDWVILVAVLLGTAASLYNAWMNYVARHDAATSARLAKHSAHEAGVERQAASTAARIAVVATGGKASTAMDPERVSGVPESFTTASGMRVKNWPSDAVGVRLSGVGPDVTAEPIYPDDPAEFNPPTPYRYRRPDGDPWNFTHDDQSELVQHWDRREYEQKPPASEPPDPTRSGAPSSPTGSAPEDPSPNGMESWTPPAESYGTGGGATSRGSHSGPPSGLVPPELTGSDSSSPTEPMRAESSPGLPWTAPGTSPTGESDG